MSGNGKPRSTVQPAWLTGDGGSESSATGTTVSKSTSSASASGEASQVKSESSQPKFEPKKPMFVPKVPVKKEAPAAAAASASTQNAEAGKTDNRNNGDKGKKNNGKPFTINKFTPKGKSVGFSDGNQEKRKWVMPVGAAFFTGTNSVGGSAASASSASSSGKTIIAAPTAKAPVTNSNGTTRILRPNEIIDEAPTRVVKSASNSSFMSYQSAPESDSDADEDEGTGDNHEDSNLITNEVWPPVEYDPLAPLALPLGPRSVAMRAQLAAEPILADPMDEQALEREQTSNLFVLQMPSDLKFDKIAANNKDLTGGELNGSNVRIGKMQLLASGKVRLVTLDGNVYEVNSGMASSFVQILAAMDVPEGEVVKSAAENALGHAHEGSGSSAGASKKAANTAASLGLRDAASERSVMDLMGSITKKLVITPAGDIGVRRQRSYSVTAPSAGQVPRGAGEYLQSMQARSYEEEEVVMMEG